MKEFEIEVSKTVHDYFIAESEDEAIDKAMQKFKNETVEIYTLDETDLGENKPCPPAVDVKFNEDSLNKLTDEELENLKTTIDMIKGARVNEARKEAIKAFNEAVKRVCDLNLTITAYNDDGECFDIYDAQSLEVIL